MFLMWLGEQITARGIGNGISLIIFVGIIAEIPAAAQFFASGRFGGNQPCSYRGRYRYGCRDHSIRCFMERALRKIMIQYPRRQVGMKVMEGQNSHLPVKVNPAGVILLFLLRRCCCRPQWHFFWIKRAVMSRLFWLILVQNSQHI